MKFVFTGMSGGVPANKGMLTTFVFRFDLGELEKKQTDGYTTYILYVFYCMNKRV